jgi:hypothetical protein
MDPTLHHAVTVFDAQKAKKKGVCAQGIPLVKIDWDYNKVVCE